MDIKPLVEQIVLSEDPVLEFSKVASDLTDEFKVSLAREVNKTLFTTHLQNSNLNKNVEFNVVSVPELHKIASAEETPTNGHLEKIAAEKKSNITPDMFMLKEANVSVNSATTYNQDDPLLKEAIAIDRNKEAEKELEQIQQITKQAEESAKYILEEEKEIRYKDIANSINNEEELKTFTKIALEKDMEYVARRVIENYKPDHEYFKKVAAESLTLEKDTYFRQELEELDVLEKEAGKFTNVIVNTIGGTVNGAGKLGKGLVNTTSTGVKVVGKVGRFALRHPILAISAAGGALVGNTHSDYTYNNYRGV